MTSKKFATMASTLLTAAGGASGIRSTASAARPKRESIVGGEKTHRRAVRRAVTLRRPGRSALFGRNALHTSSCVSMYGPPIRSMQ